MTAVRKFVDSSALADLFDLPHAFKGRKVEVILLPVDDAQEEAFAKVDTSRQESFPQFTMAQIEEWAKAPEIQTLVGVLKGAGLSADISMTDIRNERLAERYTA